MKKNGFTLLELVAVIVILALIGLLAMPLVTNMINSNKNKLFNSQIKNIQEATKNWGAANMFILPDEEDEVLNITLAHLKATGFIDKNITNPNTDKKFSNDMKITITYRNKGLIYNVLENTGIETNELDEINSSQPTISLLGKSTITTSNYIDPGVIAMIPSGEVIDTIDYKIDSGEFESSLDTSSLSVGTHTITYKVINGEYTDQITRTVTISE